VIFPLNGLTLKIIGFSHEIGWKNGIKIFDPNFLKLFFFWEKNFFFKNTNFF